MRRTIAPSCLFTMLFAAVAVPVSSHASGQNGDAPKRGDAPSCSTAMVAEYDSETGSVDLREGDVRILRYNHKAVNAPPGFFEGFPPGTDIPGIRRIAVPRSAYIHPLFGPDGTLKLTDDWPRDHLHHRGIFWSWPEVIYDGRTSDPFALLTLFTRPRDGVSIAGAEEFVEFTAENQWLWEDRTSIVHETVNVRAWRSTQGGRFIDLTLTFEALKEGVFIARRDTREYGGLNVRLRHLAQEEIRTPQRLDESSSPHRNWGHWTGLSTDEGEKVGLAIFEHPQNPDYPGDWKVYPELPWFQPCFPRQESRYELVPGERLVLRYRLWVHRGRPNDTQLNEAFDAYVASTENSSQDFERDSDQPPK